MSISNTLANALSGLTVAARSADLVSSNVANAMTEGYGVRRLEVSSRVVGASGSGVRIDGVSRHEDRIATANRRRADADFGFQSQRSSYLQRLETLIGVPGDPGSLSGRVAEFEASLLGAANAPQSQAHLSQAIENAVALSDTIGRIADGIQDERLNADQAIGSAVDLINDRLQRLADLNTLLKQSNAGSRDVSALLDTQAKHLNDIAPYFSIQVQRDSYGALKIFSDEGQVLLDGRPAELSFTSVGVMDPFITTSNGLSGLEINGRPITMSGGRTALPGGELAALFETRDAWGVEAQAQIDAVARDLADRFAGTTLDPTLAAGAPGLFTDQGTEALSANEVGLAQRLSVNAAVLPSEGGAHWRLRDGLGATAEGSIGNADFLLRQIDALSELRVTASGGFSQASRSFASLTSEHLTGIGFARHTADIDQSHASAQVMLFRESELGQGVDTDAEMQRLLQIEQAYAANARVVEAAQEMLDELMGMI